MEGVDWWWAAVKGYTEGKIGRWLVRFQLLSLEFFIDIILPIGLWPWGQLNL
jgi:hypothetical protein